MNRKKKREEDDGWGSGWFVQLLPTTQSRGPTHRVGASSFFSSAAPPPESFNTGREREALRLSSKMAPLRIPFYSTHQDICSRTEEKDEKLLFQNNQNEIRAKVHTLTILPLRKRTANAIKQPSASADE
jgi:hypothetical protein